MIHLWIGKQHEAESLADRMPPLILAGLRLAAPDRDPLQQMPHGLLVGEFQTNFIHPKADLPDPNHLGLECLIDAGPVQGNLHNAGYCPIGDHSNPTGR